MSTITVAADDRCMDDINALIEKTVEPFGCPVKIQHQIMLAAEEIFVNIAHYAYAGKEGTAEVSAEVAGMPATLTLSFKDSGMPFNPLAKKDADITLSAEERQIGGLGILLVKKIMDDVVYQYDNGFNCLTIKKSW